MRLLFLFSLALVLTSASVHATPLHDAVGDGDIDRVKMLVNSGVDLNATIDSEEARGVTALMVAAGGGYTDIVIALVEAGADPNAAVETEEVRGFTALMVAAGLGHTDVVTALIEAGADPNAASRSRGGAWPYSLARRCGGRSHRFRHYPAPGGCGSSGQGRKRAYSPQHRRYPRAHQYHPCATRRER